MRKYLYIAVGLLLSAQAVAQEDVTYQKPPQEILELVDYDRAPAILMDDKHENVLLVYTDTYKTLADLSEEEMKLAGLRINPKTNISSTTRYFKNIKYKKLLNPELKQVEGLPKNPRLTNFSWSPDQTMMAFTNTSEKGVELWILNIEEGRARQVLGARLNSNLGAPTTWMKDNSGLFVKLLPRDKPALINTKEVLPTGPTVSVSIAGQKAQNMTYQDLLSNKNDEANFESIASSEIYKLELSDKKEPLTLWKEKAIYTKISFSPDGKYVLVSDIKRPYSYIVPFQRFPRSTDIYDLSGKLVKHINDTPLQEVRPKGFMATQTGKRNIAWRADKPSTLYWVEALDGGDPMVEVDYRDEVFTLDTPFDGKAVSLAKTINRYGGILWGNDNIAILMDYWWNTRNVKEYLINPSKPGLKPVILSDRNEQDVYSDPGSYDETRNQYGNNVLTLDGNKAYLIGDGYTPEGQFPFVDQIDLTTKKKNRIYESKYTDKELEIEGILNAKAGEFLIRLQSANEYPNYFVLNTKKRIAPLRVTDFENPFKKMEGVYKEVISYKRADGVELTGTLYLPADYDREKKEKLPMVMWAYPTEYKDKSSAGQNSTNPNSFIYPFYGSPIYWVTRGYAVLDDASFPIVGEGDAEPNDTFIEQLVSNAKAAIDAVDKLGYIDRKRVAVGGHSYGAFMTANLLSHSDLFAAGIARSGAYNRTLTPFGFQAEERNYWEAPEVYNTMSPFMFADKMKTPLLLIHGGNDNNTGTHTMQSERYFNALKGFGAPTRLVILPKESHGYAAKESILHLLWEQDEWLEKYVKNRK